MARMRAIDAAALVLEREGVTCAFGVPGAAINPLYSALRERDRIRHYLGRHVEAAVHMAEGYSRATAGNIGVCLVTSGPGGTAPITKMAQTVMEPAQLPGALQRAFHLMRSGRPGPVLLDLPLDVQTAEIEFDIDTYEPLPIAKPAATRAQAEKALDLLTAAERPLLIAGGGVINADAGDLLVVLAELLGVPVVPTLMGWGAIPDDHRLMAGMAGLQTAHRYGNANVLAADFIMGIGNRFANRHTGSLDVYRRGRTFVHIDIEPTQIGRIFTPDLGIVSDARAALEQLIAVARDRREAGTLPDYRSWADECLRRKRTMHRRTDFPNVPMKPQRVYQEMNRALGRDVRYVSNIGLSQIAGAQFLHVYKPRHWIDAGQAGPLGWTVSAALGVCVADPEATVVGLSGDYDFQFLIEQLACGAQFKLPYLQVVLNNSYLGLIRQAQRAFDMDYCVQLSFENVNSPDVDGYGVDHVKVAEGLGCKAIRVRNPNDLAGAFEKALAMMAEFRVPVVLEVILERVTNIAIGTELDNTTEFEELADHELLPESAD
jgi:tartronate-semialdehyde synthase